MIPLAEEFYIFDDCLKELGISPQELPGQHKHGEFYTINVQGLECLVHLMNEMGPEAAVSAAHQLLAVCTPKIIINAGCGGSIHSDVKLLDVVVGKQLDLILDRAAVVEDSNQNVDINLAGNVYQSNASLVRIAQALPRKRALFESVAAKIHEKMDEKATKEIADEWRSTGVVRNVENARLMIVPADIACSQFVGKTSKFGEWIKTHRNRKAGCIEMEGAGIALALHNLDSKIPLLVLRGITDKADVNKNLMPDKQREALRYCGIYNVMQVLLAFLQTEDIRREVEHTERNTATTSGHLTFTSNHTSGTGSIAQANGPVTMNFN